MADTVHSEAPTGRADRLLLVFYTTSFRENFQSLKAGRTDDIYYSSIADTLQNLLDLRHFADCVVLSCLTSEPYDEVPYPGLRLIGASMAPWKNAKALVSLVEEIAPTRVILRSPIRSILEWAIRSKVRTLACFASSFEQRGLRHWLERIRLARLLNSSTVEWVSNHGVNSSLALQRLGVRPDKIVPHDYPHQWEPEFPAKELAPAANPFRLIYVGGLFEAKGVGDAIRSVKRLADQGLCAELTIAGWGDTAAFHALAARLGVTAKVHFAGPVPNSSVVSLMHDAHAVLIPSHWEYPEGLPFSIFEAMRSRTPIIASDHPMFRGHLRDGVTAVVFRSRDWQALAESVKRLSRDGGLYRRLSLGSKEAWQAMQIPTKISTLQTSWAADSAEGRRWLHDHTLASGRYGSLHGVFGESRG